MPTRATRYTADGTFTVPALVTCIWIAQMIGGGGGGAPGRSTHGGGGGGGGSGEQCAGKPLIVTPGEVVTVTVGLGGGGGTFDAGGTGGYGTSSVVKGIRCAGGHGGYMIDWIADLDAPCAGGGVGGGNIGDLPNDQIAVVGTKESSTHFGGSSGAGCVNALPGDGFPGSGLGPIYVGGLAGGRPSTQNGGSGGAASIYGTGGDGGEGGANASDVEDGFDAPSGSYGAGGGGSSGGTASRLGGDGEDGFVVISWMGPV